MLFEVWQHGVCKMATDHASCIYPEATLRGMQEAGCTFRFGGRRIALKNLLVEVKKAK